MIRLSFAAFVLFLFQLGLAHAISRSLVVSERSLSSSSHSGASVSISEVQKIFASTGPVINSLNLEIKSGEFISFLGPSGCGKSTLLRLIAGLDSPTAGQIKVESFGREFFRSFVFQDAQLLPWRTLLDNVALPLELMGQNKKRRSEKARSAIARVGLGDAADRYPAQLSGGMRMRASLARALVTEPSLLLLDEPFAALDENTRYRLQEQLRDLWTETKMTVIFVTHSVSEAVFLSERSLVFSPRPARVGLDHRSALPIKRAGSLRTEPELMAEVRILTEAFAKGEAMR